MMDELPEEGDRKEDAKSAVPTNQMIAEQLASHGEMLSSASCSSTTTSISRAGRPT